MSKQVQTGTIDTHIPALLDRLPWSLLGLLPLRLWRRLRP